MIIPTTLWNNSSHMPSALKTFSKSSLGKNLKGGYGKPMIQTQKKGQSWGDPCGHRARTWV